MGDNGMAAPMTMDLNDVEHDAFLANDRTLDDPLVVRVERAGEPGFGSSTAPLRAPSGSSSEGFAVLVAVDGNPVLPVAGSSFPDRHRPAARPDRRRARRRLPVLPQVEGKTQRTGLILARRSGDRKVADVASSTAAPVDAWRGAAAGAEPAPGPFPGCSPYHGADGIDGALPLGIDDELWPNVDPPVVREGQRVVLDMQNRTMMAHPMHLHGHHFRWSAWAGSRSVARFATRCWSRP